MKSTTRKTCYVITILLFVINYSFSQTNTLPTSGNVGIGTTSPAERLTVNGSARIDSTLTVKDSMIVDRDAHIRSDLQVDGNTTLEGDLLLKLLRDSTLADNGVLLIDPTGKVKNGGDLKSLVYLPAVEQTMPCATDMNGGYIQTAPFWQASSNPQKMFLINTPCSPDPRLGVGVKPDSKFHVRLVKDSELHPLIIDKLVSNNPSIDPYKLMELDNNGLLYAREVKVNLDSWPDYVFDANYQLMPLSELQAFIEQNNHLPNVPSACEMEEEGINVAKSNVMLMEKVEELTLYMIQMKEQLDAQKQLLQQQQELILQLQQQVKP